MKAARLLEIKRPLQIQEVPLPEAGANEVVIEVEAAALNRRDFWITQGLYPNIQLPCTLGSDACGTVISTGEGVTPDWSGKSVVVNPGLDWGPSEKCQSESFRILGMPDDGTLAQRIVIPVELLSHKPTHLSPVEAAALPLAGVTAFRALFSQGRVQPGQKVLISGIGGGVACLALQFAKAAGATVFVSSSSKDKIAKAMGLGADAGFLYTEDHWQKQAPEVDLVIDGAGGPGYNQLMSVVKPGGIIVNYGATAGAPRDLDLFKVFWKQIHIVGSTMGSPRDFSEMLHFVASHKIKPIVDAVYSLEEVNKALDHMGRSSQFGKSAILMDPKA